MPLLMIRCGGRPAISEPSNRIEPDVGASVPESILKIVLLPEPLGPIRPRISPWPTLNDTLLTAVKPPNRFTSPLTSSTVPLSSLRAFALLVAVGGALWQRQHGLALRLALGPHHGGLVLDVLDHDRKRALVLSGHRRALAVNLNPQAELAAALGNTMVERPVAGPICIAPAIFLDC